MAVIFQLLHHVAVIFITGAEKKREEEETPLSFHFIARVVIIGVLDELLINVIM